MAWVGRWAEKRSIDLDDCLPLSSAPKPKHGSTTHPPPAMLRQIACRASRTASSSGLQPTVSRQRQRQLSTSLARLQGQFPGDRPAPPRLPAHLQKEFEELQRRAATPLAKPKLSTTLDASQVNNDTSSGGAADSTAATATIDEEDLHPDIRRKPRPEFQGDVNPKTGEVGGPKNDPLAYEKEWSYGGRATDF